MPKESSGGESIRHNFKQPTPSAGEGHSVKHTGKGPEKNPTLTSGKGDPHLPNARVGKGSGQYTGN